jgi:hypothetical protein
MRSLRLTTPGELKLFIYRIAIRGNIISIVNLLTPPDNNSTPDLGRVWEIGFVVYRRGGGLCIFQGCRPLPVTPVHPFRSVPLRNGTERNGSYFKIRVTERNGTEGFPGTP